ncbi:hypothetical protein GGF46_002771 [Coemansia sp. RSA 552]|nr:hypothetical protein GGF46_002771 [Coemansia sp. RSA 552]
MTSKLPPELLRLFTPRPPPVHVAPVDSPAGQRPAPQITGIAGYAAALAGAPKGEASETAKQRKERIRAERMKQARDNVARGLSAWDPSLNLQATEDPYKTIVVARLNYDTTEKELRDVFERYGDIAGMKMVKDMDGNFRGYAFIEYAHESDMREAYRCADGMRILGRRIVVDVERGRTVKGWAPRRFGGGLGGTRVGGKEDNQREPGRFDPSAPPPGPARRLGGRARDRGSQDHPRSRSRGYAPNRSTGGQHDSWSRGYGRDSDRDRDRDRGDRRTRRYRSRSPSSRPMRRDRSHDHGGSSYYSRRY